MFSKDVLYEIDGQPVMNRRQVMDILEKSIDKEVNVKVWRRIFSGEEKSEMDLELTLTPEKANKTNSVRLFGGGW